jgi:hypothetical protein
MVVLVASAFDVKKTFHLGGQTVVTVVEAAT